MECIDPANATVETEPSATILATPYATVGETVSQMDVDAAKAMFGGRDPANFSYNAVVAVTVMVPVRFTVPVAAASAADACEKAIFCARSGQVAGVRDWSSASPYYVESISNNGRLTTLSHALENRLALVDWLRAAVGLRRARA